MPATGGVDHPQFCQRLFDLGALLLQFGNGGIVAIAGLAEQEADATLDVLDDEIFDTPVDVDPIELYDAAWTLLEAGRPATSRWRCGMRTSRCRTWTP